MRAKNKPMPSLASDAAAERFVQTADLSTYDLSGFKQMPFDFEPATGKRRLGDGAGAGHIRGHLLLIDDASQGLADISAGRVKDAGSALAAIKRRRSG